MSHADDRVGGRDRVVGEREPPDLLGIAGDVAGEVEHRRGGVRRDHPVSGVDQVPREQSASAPDLDDQAVPCEHGLERCEHPGSARVGVEPEPAVMNEREIAPVVRRAGRLHVGHPKSPPAPCGIALRSGSRGET